jgi:predicted DNA-binding protein (MmcQ/YjbR family)
MKMTRVTKGIPMARPGTTGLNAPMAKATEALQAVLDAMPCAYAEPVPVPRGRPTPALMYKLMGKMFAILSIRGEAFVIVKCDPGLADILRQTYGGVGHRSHLDRRFWISIDLDADVPPDEIRKLIAGSYDLIHASLTRKQKAELAAQLQG